MAVESATYISDFTITKPAGSEDRGLADDYLRQIKSVLQNTFPNADGAYNLTDTEANYVVGVTSAIQTQIDAKSPIASPTFTGTVTAAALTTTGVTTVADLAVDSYNEDAASYTVTTGTKGLDLSASTYFYPSGDMGTSSITFTFDNPASSGRVTSFTLELLGADDATIAFPAAVTWANNITPVWTSGVDIVSFVTRDAGTTWHGFLGGLNQS